jgi:uncharacterized protein (TIGR03435 family)
MMSSKAASMQDLAESLEEALQHPVLDQTGLSGAYEVDLKFAPVAPDPSDSGTAPPIFEALQEQLGLKLVTVKAPVRVLVVDYAQKPSAN